MNTPNNSPEQNPAPENRENPSNSPAINEIKDETRNLIFRIFTISSGIISEGAPVNTFTLKGAGTKIPAIIVGESGRGRNLGVLPIHLPPDLFEEWSKNDTVIIHAAEIGTTKTGKPKLYVKPQANTTDNIIVVFPTKIGYRGGNAHTGDRTGETKKDWAGNESLVFHPFPTTQILTEGTIAQGDAGRMGSGAQLVALMPKDTVFRTAYSGRLYGNPPAHYYLWNGKKVLTATWDDRQASDIF